MTDGNEALSTVQSLADIATNEDKLFHDGYVKGVTAFIRGCATPMTIAIQGDWGTGKTSLINLIEAELRAAESTEDDEPRSGKYSEDIINVATVDAWQQSIVNPNASLFEIVLGEMISRLAGADLATMQKVSEFASAATNIMSTMAGNEDKPKDDSLLGSIIDSLFYSEEDEKSESEGGYVSVEAIESLRTGFVEALRESAEENGKSDDSRLIVFIDGLDHINPEAAVDLMEQIKNYLDCPRCVFVLAVDERTVFDGIKKKFGDKVDERRRKMFFDKLIQVPLRIPTSAYNLEKYIKDLLTDGKEHSGDYAEVIGALLSEPTPLSIKRYINTMYLYQSIFGSLGSDEDGSLAMLLAAVILEVESTQGFDAVVNCAQGDEARFDENLEAALSSLSLNDGINRAMLPALWRSGDGVDEDTAKRSAFLSWIRKLK